MAIKLLTHKPSKIWIPLLKFEQVDSKRWMYGNYELKVWQDNGTVSIEDVNYKKRSTSSTGGISIPSWADSLGIIDFAGMVEVLAHHMYNDFWRDEYIKSNYTMELPFWYPQHKQRIYKSVLSKEFKPIYDKMRSMISPELIKVQKRLFSGTGRFPGYRVIDIALAMEYPQDLFSHPAAVLACWGYPTWYYVGMNERANWDWIGFYNPNNNICRRALYRIPGGLTFDHVRGVVQLPLRQPPTPFRKRWTLLHKTYERFFRYGDPHPYEYMNDGYIHDLALGLIERSSDRQIREAYRRVARYRHFDPAGRKLEHNSWTWNFVLDAPIPTSHTATIIAWADVSIDWHRNQDQIREQQEREWAERMKTITFPPLPAEPPEGFTYISRPQELFDEARLMDNCAGSYVDRCIRGTSFIFHYNEPPCGDAILEVVGGVVKQSWGTRNHATDVSKRARRKLVSWAKEHLTDYRPKVELPPAHLRGRFLPEDLEEIDF